MSIFTSRVTVTLTVPHDPTQTVTIRKLAPAQLERAAKAQQQRSLKELREMGGGAFIRELQGLTEGRSDVAFSADPFLLYDRLTLIEAGVQSWTYDAPLERVIFEDLDEETASWLAQAILKLAKPALFQSAEEQETARKNV